MLIHVDKTKIISKQIIFPNTSKINIFYMIALPKSKIIIIFLHILYILYNSSNYIYVLTINFPRLTERHPEFLCTILQGAVFLWQIQTWRFFWANLNPDWISKQSE